MAHSTSSNRYWHAARAPRYSLTFAFPLLVAYETLAFTPDRHVVAQSTLAMSLEENPTVYQWGTFVHREHRGHKLGLATKAVNLRAVQKARDDLRLVVTQNAETNDYMVAINERMGFLPIEIAGEFVKRL